SVLQLDLEVAQLALRAPARQPAGFQRRHAGGIISAIFEALERVHELDRHRFATKDANDSAHSKRRSRYPLRVYISRNPYNGGELRSAGTSPQHFAGIMANGVPGHGWSGFGRRLAAFIARMRAAP